MGKFILQILKAKKKTIAISIILVLIVPVLLGSSLYYLTIDDASWKEAEYSSTPYAASTYTSKATVGTNGIAVSETAQQLWDKMIKEGSNVNDYLEGPEELEKLMNAEIITQYPKIGAGELDGIIQFKRKSSDGTEKILSYKTQEQLNSAIQKYTSEGNEEVLNYYSLDDEGNALVAISTEIVTNTDGQVSTVRNMTTSKIPYKQMVSQYTMPFDYLWTWLVITEDKDFVFSLVDLIQNSEIIVGICDNSTVSESTTVKKYTEQKRTDTFVTVRAESDYGVSNYPNKRNWLPKDSEQFEGYESDYQGQDYSTTTKITTTTTNIKFDILKANTWIIDYSKDYSYSKPVSLDSDPTIENLDDTEFEALEGNPNILEGQSKNDNGHAQSLRLEAINYIKVNMPKQEDTAEESDVDLPQASPRLTDEEFNRGDYTPKNENIVDVIIEEVKCNYYTRKINQTEENTLKTTTQQYTEALPTTNPKVDRDSEENNFVKLFTQSKKARSNLDGIEEWLFEALESNTNLDAKWIDITKYLLNCYYDSEKYGDVNIDWLTVFEVNSFSNVSSIYGNTVQEKVWWALKDLGYTNIAIAGAMGNIEHESGGFNPSKVEDGYNEFNGGIGICQWTNDYRGSEGRNTMLKDYAKSKEKNWQDENIQIEYLIAELTEEEEGWAENNLLESSDMYDGIRHSPDEWINAKDIETATKIFCYCFERPGDIYARSSMHIRIAAANKYLKQFENAERPTDGKISEQGDGYDSIYVVGSKTYKLYYQSQGSYAQQLYSATGENGSIANIGCCPTSMSIVASGYGIDINPGKMANLMGGANGKGNSSVENAANVFKSLGLNATSYRTINEEILKSHLLTGNSLIISVAGSNPEGSRFTSETHYMALIDIRQENGKYQVYVANPNPKREAGWFDISVLVSAASGRWCTTVSK